MRVNRTFQWVIAVAAGLLWTLSAGAGAQATAPKKAEQGLKVGKKGDVELRVQTVVGEMKLNPGRYELQHRAEGDAHFVPFTEISKGLPQGHAGVGYGREAPIAHPGEVQCRLEPLDKKVSTTTIYAVQEGEASRVTRLIAGENVGHIF